VQSGFDAITDELVQKSREMYRMVREHDVAFLDNLDLALEYHLPRGLGGPVHGPWAVLEVMDAAVGLFEDPHPEPEEFLPSGDALIVLGTWHGKARSTGASVVAPFAHVQRFRGGKIADFRVYMDSAEILGPLQEAPSG
jgi:ketosteroid isomerase-like protein